MISKLPRWIEYGAFVLSFIAGFINAIGLLAFERQAISHVSGTLTLLGTSVLSGSFETAVFLATILASFLIGASISGFLLRSSALRLGHHYDTALLIEAVLIFISYWLLTNGHSQGLFVASTACGIQNALATTYSGAIVRTTHLTGIFTDLGIMLGAALHGEPFDRRKAILFLLIIAGFISGGMAGVFFFGMLNYKALLAPGLMCMCLAFGYRLYKLSHQSQ